MVRSAQLSRVAALESWLGMNDGPPTTVFVKVVDSSVDDDGVPAPDYDEATVTGVQQKSSALHLLRRPKESVQALQSRAEAMNPGTRVWMLTYAAQGLDFKSDPR